MSFTHLQVRSGYSLMNSTLTIEKLVKRAKELNFKAIALTDENVLYGAIPFFQACKSNGLKPIIGMLTTVVSLNQEKDQCILDRKSTRLNSSHVSISYAVFCLKKTKDDT